MPSNVLSLNVCGMCTYSLIEICTLVLPQRLSMSGIHTSNTQIKKPETEKREEHWRALKCLTPWALQQCPVWCLNGLHHSSCVHARLGATLSLAFFTFLHLQIKAFLAESSHCNSRLRLSTVYHKVGLIHHTAKKEADSSWKRRRSCPATAETVAQPAVANSQLKMHI